MDLYHTCLSCRAPSGGLCSELIYDRTDATKNQTEHVFDEGVLRQEKEWLIINKDRRLYFHCVVYYF